MKKISFVLGSLALLLMVGAGCSGQTATNSETASKPADTPSNQIETTTPEKTPDSIVLNAEALGSGTVKFEWTVPQALESTEGYRILYGKEANPTEPALYYFERGPSYRDKTWSGLPAGKAHFRVCSITKGSCWLFSNDVEVDIK